MASDKIAVFGVPSAAGGVAPGTERAPFALREAGLLDALRGGSRRVVNLSDLSLFAFADDKEHPRFRNAEVVAADFPDVNRIGGTVAFPDLRVTLRPEGGRLVLDGSWSSPPRTSVPLSSADGLMAVRFHLPSRIYDHRSAPEGVERGNILGWRQGVAEALEGHPIAFGATLDTRSILWSTVALFAAAIACALGLIAAAFALVVRRGRRRTTG